MTQASRRLCPSLNRLPKASLKTLSCQTVSWGFLPADLSANCRGHRNGAEYYRYQADGAGAREHDCRIAGGPQQSPYPQRAAAKFILPLKTWSSGPGQR